MHPQPVPGGESSPARGEPVPTAGARLVAIRNCAREQLAASGSTAGVGSSGSLQPGTDASRADIPGCSTMTGRICPGTRLRRPPRRPFGTRVRPRTHPRRNAEYRRNDRRRGGTTRLPHHGAPHHSSAILRRTPLPDPPDLGLQRLQRAVVVDHDVGDRQPLAPGSPGPPSGPGRPPRSFRAAAPAGRAGSRGAASTTTTTS